MSSASPILLHVLSSVSWRIQNYWCIMGNWRKMSLPHKYYNIFGGKEYDHVTIHYYAIFACLVPLHNPPCQVLELGKNVLYISRPCSTLVGISGGIVIPPDDGWDSGLVSLSVLNHCEGRVVELSTVFDNNVIIHVIGAILCCLGLKVWKIQRGMWY